MNLNLKGVLMGTLMVTFCLPVTAYSQAPIDTTGAANGTILLVARNETGIPGYVHEKYALVDHYCSSVEVVDYYGPPTDSKDANLIAREQTVCVELMFDKGDAE